MSTARIYHRLGELIKIRRHIIGISQQQLADRVRMSRGSVANIEVGRQRILLHDIETFSRALRCKPIELVSRLWT